MKSRLAVVTLVLGLLLTGCGGVEDTAETGLDRDASATAEQSAQPLDVLSSQEESPEPTPSPTPTPTPTPTPEDAADEVEQPAVEQVAAAVEEEPEPEPELVAGPLIWGVGSSGEDVRRLQARLRQIWWFNQDPTGYYGEVTAAAVSGFQGKRGFPVVGYVDQRTWDRIVSMTNEPTQEEMYPPPPEPEPEPEVEVVVAPPPGLDSRCMTGRAICIDKSRSVLRWVVDGQVQLTLDARFGSADLPTREGQFTVTRKVRDEVSRTYDNAPMPFSLYFYGGQAVHYSPGFAAQGYNGYSHGCVNTRDWNGMSALFDAAQVGDKVVVYWS